MRDLEQEEPGGTQAVAIMAIHGGAEELTAPGGQPTVAEQVVVESEMESRRARVMLRIQRAKAEQTEQIHKAAVELERLRTKVEPEGRRSLTEPDGRGVAGGVES